MALPPESLEELFAKASVACTAAVEAIVAEGPELPPDPRLLDEFAGPGPIADTRLQVVRLRPLVTLLGSAPATIEATKPVAPYSLSAGGVAPSRWGRGDGVFFLSAPAPDGRYEILCLYGPWYPLQEVEQHLTTVAASKETRSPRWLRRR